MRSAALSPEELARVKAAYARLRRRQFYAVLPMIALALSPWLSSSGVVHLPFLDPRRGLLLWVFIPVGVATIAFSIWNWRCPACRAYLGKTTDARHCRRCGVLLRD